MPPIYLKKPHQYTAGMPREAPIMNIEPLFSHCIRAKRGAPHLFEKTHRTNEISALE
jgi:hypothetical protein